MTNAQSEYGDAMDVRLERAMERIENALGRLTAEGAEAGKEIESLRAECERLREENGRLKDRQQEASKGLDNTIGRLKVFLED